MRGRGFGDQFVLAVMREDTTAVEALLDEMVEVARAGQGVPLLFVAWFTDHFGSAERAARELLDPSVPMARRSSARAELAALLVGQGRWREASAELERLGDADPARARLEHAVLVSLPFLRVAPDEIRLARDRLAGWSPATAGPRTPAESAYERHKRLYLLALLSSKLGEWTAAGAYADSIEALDDPAGTAVPEGLVATVRADVAWRSGRGPEAVLRELEPVRGQVPAGAWRDRVLTQEHARYMRASALHSVGRSDEALRWLRDSFIVAVGYHYYKAPVRYLSAAVLEALGRPDEAAEARAGFERLWSRADPEVAEALREEAER